MQGGTKAGDRRQGRSPARGEGANESYGPGERAHRTAFASVKHVAEKKGDHWELKDEQGPSDPQADQSGRAARDNPKRTYGGVDANKSKQELYDDAKEAVRRAEARIRAVERAS